MARDSSWLMRTAWIWSVDITRSMSSCPTPYEIGEMNVFWFVYLLAIGGLLCVSDVGDLGQTEMVKLRVFLYITSHDSAFFFVKNSNLAFVRKWHWIFIKKKAQRKRYWKFLLFFCQLCSYIQEDNFRIWMDKFLNILTITIT